MSAAFGGVSRGWGVFLLAIAAVPGLGVPAPGAWGGSLGRVSVQPVRDTENMQRWAAWDLGSLLSKAMLRRAFEQDPRVSDHLLEEAGVSADALDVRLPRMPRLTGDVDADLAEAARRLLPAHSDELFNAIAEGAGEEDAATFALACHFTVMLTLALDDRESQLFRDAAHAASDYGRRSGIASPLWKPAAEGWRSEMTTDDLFDRLYAAMGPGGIEAHLLRFANGELTAGERRFEAAQLAFALGLVVIANGMSGPALADKPADAWEDQWSWPARLGVVVPEPPPPGAADPATLSGVPGSYDPTAWTDPIRYLAIDEASDLAAQLESSLGDGTGDLFLLISCSSAIKLAGAGSENPHDLLGAVLERYERAGLGSGLPRHVWAPIIEACEAGDSMEQVDLVWGDFVQEIETRLAADFQEDTETGNSPPRAKRVGRR